MTILDTLVDTDRFMRVIMYEIETVVFEKRTLLINRVWYAHGTPAAVFRFDAGARNPYVVTRERGRERATLVVPPYGPKLVAFQIDPQIIAQLKQQRYRHFIDDSDWA